MIVFWFQLNPGVLSATINILARSAPPPGVGRNKRFSDFFKNGEEISSSMIFFLWRNECEDYFFPIFWNRNSEMSSKRGNYHINFREAYFFPIFWNRNSEMSSFCDIEGDIEENVIPSSAWHTIGNRGGHVLNRYFLLFRTFSWDFLNIFSGIT